MFWLAERFEVHKMVEKMGSFGIAPRQKKHWIAEQDSGPKRHQKETAKEMRDEEKEEREEGNHEGLLLLRTGEGV